MRWQTSTGEGWTASSRSRNGEPRFAAAPTTLPVAVVRTSWAITTSVRSRITGHRPPLRPAGPHVSARRVVELARTSLHGLRLVGHVHTARRSLELHEQRQSPSPGSDHALRLDRPDLPAPSTRCELALLSLRGYRARLRG